MADAKSSLNPASVEFARSLEVDIIPEKLRCATCNRLAIHAVKLGCCDSTICGECSQSVDATQCPVCEHSPFSTDLVSPAKSLQTTVKVFIKNEAKKRAIDLTGDAPKPIATAPAAVKTPPVVAAEAAPVEPDVSAAAKVDEAAQAAETVDGSTAGAAQDREVPAEDGAEEGLSANKTADADQDEEDDDDDDDIVITTERPEHEKQPFQEAEGEQPQYDHQTNGVVDSHSMQTDRPQDFNNHFNQGMNGFGHTNFGNMNMNGFNPMMGMPNMMAMPNMIGMNMDPSMMFGGNFGGMGDMSAMMGMGMGNMGGNMSGMGDFNGMGGPGFFPNQGNYMQSQNYGNGHRSNDFYNNRGYGRGYGRGFGRGTRGNQFGRGRGGWGYQQIQQYGNHNPFAQHQSGGPQQTGANTSDVLPQRRGSPSYDAVPANGTPAVPANGTSTETGNGTPAETGAKSHDMETNGDQNVPGDTNHAEDDTNAAGDNKDVTMVNGGGDHAHDPSQGVAEQGGVGFEAHAAMQGGDSNMADASMQDPSFGDFEGGMQERQQVGHGHQGHGGRGGFRGRGGAYGAFGGRGTDSTDLTPAPAPPVNAPTGPKAMREGKPNTGYFSRLNMAPKPTPTSAPQARQGSRARSIEPQKQKATRDDDIVRDRSPPRSRPQLREDGKGNVYDDDRESDAAYERRKEREREKRKKKDRERRHEEGDRSDGKRRSRSESRTDDSSRRRHRDKEDEEYRPSRTHRDRSKDKHRSRRHRSRSPAKDHADEDHSRRKSKSDRHGGDYRSSRKHASREEEYGRKSARSSKHDRATRADSRREPEREAPRKIIEPPSDELGFKIKGSKSARANREKEMAPLAAPAVSSDPYAEERARAQQNREAREAQRRLSTQSSSLGKRGRDDETVDAPTGPRGDRSRNTKKGRKERRISYKYEDEVGGDDDRDAHRWR